MITATALFQQLSISWAENERLRQEVESLRSSHQVYRDLTAIFQRDKASLLAQSGQAVVVVEGLPRRD